MVISSVSLQVIKVRPLLRSMYLWARSCTLMLRVSSCSSPSSYSLSWVWVSARRAAFSSSPLSFSSFSLWLSCSSLRNSYNRNTQAHTVCRITHGCVDQVTWRGRGSHKDVWPCAWLWPVPAFGSPRARPAHPSSGTDSGSDPDELLTMTSPETHTHTHKQSLSRQCLDILTTWA